MLHIASGWARDHGRRLLALTVDHGLHPDSARWTAFARDAAIAAGADWRGLSWEGPKPATGLPAAARTARHRLIADAARTAGARVILFAHTAGDVAEGDLMRTEGSTLGHLRDWSPSPAWPDGRGLMLLRPMLDVERGDLRDWLAGLGAQWIDDPSNEDLKYARSRARRQMRGGSREVGRRSPLTLSREDAAAATLPSGLLALGEGSFTIDRSVSSRALAALLVCAGGGDNPPRGDRLEHLMQRLKAGGSFTATLCGARLEVTGDHVLVTRESGEFSRRPPPPLPLAPGVEAVWDGRWAISIAEHGWRAVPAAGRMARLSKADRARLNALPPAARGGQPVLVRNGEAAPVLAETAATTRSLVDERLALALDRMTHEMDLNPGADGALPRNHLFSGADITEQGRSPRFQGSRRE